MLLVTTLNLIYFSFNFWVSIAVVAVSQVCVVSAGAVLHEEGSNPYLLLLVNSGLLLAAFVPLHILLNQAILHHLRVRCELAELKAQQTGDKLLFDDFGEALIVMDALSDRVLFKNKVCDKIKPKDTEDQQSEQIDWIDEVVSKRQFALCPQKIFQQHTPDSRDTI